MKRIALLLCCLLALAFAGCTHGSYAVRNAVEQNGNDSMAMRYDTFNGYKATSIRLDEGQTCTVYVDIVSDEGELNLSATGEDGESYYQGTNLPTSSFSFLLGRAGRYEIKAEGRNHSGSYKIKWEIEEEK